jgi:hypothetical protein
LDFGIIILLGGGTSALALALLNRFKGYDAIVAGACLMISTGAYMYLRHDGGWGYILACVSTGLLALFNAATYLPPVVKKLPVEVGLLGIGLVTIASTFWWPPHPSRWLVLGATILVVGSLVAFLGIMAFRILSLMFTSRRRRFQPRG